MKSKIKLSKILVGLVPLIALTFAVVFSLMSRAQAGFSAKPLQTQTVNGTKVELMSASMDGDTLRANVCYPHPDGKEILPVGVTLETNGKSVPVDLVGATTWFAANGKQVNWRANQTDEKDTFRLATEFLTAGQLVRRCDVFVFKNASVITGKSVRLGIEELHGGYPEGTRCADLENGIAKNKIPNEIAFCRDEEWGGMSFEMKGATDADRSKASGKMFDTLFGTVHGPWSFAITAEMLATK